VLPNTCKQVPLALLLCSCTAAPAASLWLNPAADTTLIEVAPTNSNGGQLWVNAGTTQNGPSVRGLFRFDLAVVPTNAVVGLVSLSFQVVHQPVDGLENAPFGLYRMLRAWGEGTNANLGNPGQGSPAATGDATWTCRFYSTNTWGAPGGAPGIDFVPVESSYTYIYGVDQSPYLFGSTPELVADVQGWVRQPASNYGWMLRCDDEGTLFTARRFASREDANNAPILQVDYLVPPGSLGIQHTGAQTTLSFLAWPQQNYRLEYSDLLGTNSWLTLATVNPQPQASRVLVIDTAPAPRRFYRLATW
jgi:hypothetical protein